MNGKAEVSRIAAIETVVFLHRKRFTFARRPSAVSRRWLFELGLVDDLWRDLSIFGMAWGGGLGYADVVATR